MEDVVTTETRAVAAAPPAAPDRVRHGHARAVVLVMTGVMAAAAFVLGAVGSQARSRGSEERAQHERRQRVVARSNIGVRSPTATGKRSSAR